MEEYLKKLDPDHFRSSIVEGLSLHLPLQNYKKNDELYTFFYEQKFLNSISNSEIKTVRYEEAHLNLICQYSFECFSTSIEQINRDHKGISEQKSFFEFLLVSYSLWIKSLPFSLKDYFNAYKKIRSNDLKEPSVINKYIFLNQVNFNEFATLAVRKMIVLVQFNKEDNDYNIDWKLRMSSLYNLAYQWSINVANLKRHKSNIQRSLLSEMNRIDAIKNSKKTGANIQFLPIYYFRKKEMIQMNSDLKIAKKPFNLSTRNINILLGKVKRFNYFKDDDEKLRQFFANNFLFEDSNIKYITLLSSQKVLIDFVFCLEGMGLLDVKCFKSEIIKKGIIKSIDPKTGKSEYLNIKSFDSEIRRTKRENKITNSIQIDELMSSLVSLV